MAAEFQEFAGAPAADPGSRAARETRIRLSQESQESQAEPALRLAARAEPEQQARFVAEAVAEQTRASVALRPAAGEPEQQTHAFQTDPWSADAVDLMPAEDAAAKDAPEPPAFAPPSRQQALYFPQARRPQASRSVWAQRHPGR